MSERLEAALRELDAAHRNLAAVLLEEAAAVRSPQPVRLLSVAEVLRATGVARSTLYTEIQTGRLRSISIGRRRLIPADALEAFVAEHAA
jgi:excisionase family DNA binding protein